MARGQNSSHPDSRTLPRLPSTMLKLVLKQWFLVALLLILGTGFGFSSPMKRLPEQVWLNQLIVVVTMFVLAWPIAFGQLLHSFRKPGPVLLAFAINLIAIPLVAWPLSKMLGAELGPGLIVLAATPSTLASAAVWTRRAGGNDVVAIMNTILTNGLCFVILPGWVWLLHGQTTGTQNFWKTAGSLLLLVVMPMMLSQVARRIHPASAIWATRKKILLSLVAQVGILMMVLIGAVQAGERLREGGSGLDLFSILLMIGVVGGLHLAAWWGGFELGHAFGFDRADRIGVAFSGSQKTLMIGLTTALQLQLSILPLVSYHLLQLVLGTLIADNLRRHAPVSEIPAASSLGIPPDSLHPVSQRP